MADPAITGRAVRYLGFEESRNDGDDAVEVAAFGDSCGVGQLAEREERSLSERVRLGGRVEPRGGAAEPVKRVRPSLRAGVC
jgi:hypothetical protein